MLRLGSCCLHHALVNEIRSRMNYCRADKGAQDSSGFDVFRGFYVSTSSPHARTTNQLLFNFSTCPAAGELIEHDAARCKRGVRFTNLESLSPPDASHRKLSSPLSSKTSFFNHRNNFFLSFINFITFFLLVVSTKPTRCSLPLTAQESTKHFQTKSMRLICDLYGESEE